MNTKTSAKWRDFTFVLAILFAVGSVCSCSLDPVPEDYQWEMERTSVKNQGNTGTCWAFAAISFLESECIRKNTANEQLDLSEAYVVYYAFLEKARSYLETMEESMFSEGGWSNDVLYIVDKYGIVREDDYEITESFKAELNKIPWFLENDNLFEINRLPVDSTERIASQDQTTPSILQQMYSKRLMNRLRLELDLAIKNYQDEGTIPEQVIIATLQNIKTILNEEIGAVPEEISYNGNVITPLYFTQNILGIHSNDYVHITSFEHLGFNEIVQLPPPWFVNGQYINVETELFYEITRLALTLNYGLVIECKVDPGFHPIAGKANPILYPEDIDYEKIESLRVNRYSGMTSNNHLMHMVGFDETISPWFLIKNSWGDMFGTIPLGTKEYRGYINMSKIYFLLKTPYVTVHKDMLEYFPEIEQ